MSNSKRTPLIFVYPLDPCLKDLYEFLKGQNLSDNDQETIVANLDSSVAVEIFEVDLPSEVKQLVPLLESAVLLITSPKKCADILRHLPDLKLKSQYKVLLFSDKEVGQESIQKFRKVGLNDFVVTPIPRKNLIFKISLFCKSTQKESGFKSNQQLKEDAQSLTFKKSVDQVEGKLESSVLISSRSNSLVIEDDDNPSFKKTNTILEIEESKIHNKNMSFDLTQDEETKKHCKIQVDEEEVKKNSSLLVSTDEEEVIAKLKKIDAETLDPVGKIKLVLDEDQEKNRKIKLLIDNEIQIENNAVLSTTSKDIDDSEKKSMEMINEDVQEIYKEQGIPLESPQLEKQALTLLKESKDTSSSESSSQYYDFREKCVLTLKKLFAQHYQNCLYNKNQFQKDFFILSPSSLIMLQKEIIHSSHLMDFPIEDFQRKCILEIMMIENNPQIKNKLETNKMVIEFSLYYPISFSKKEVVLKLTIVEHVSSQEEERLKSFMKVFQKLIQWEIDQSYQYSESV
jgi:hypothetical protein